MRPSRYAALENLDGLIQTARCYPKRLGARSTSCAFWYKGQRSRLDAQLELRAPDCAFSLRGCAPVQAGQDPSAERPLRRLGWHLTMEGRFWLTIRSTKIVPKRLGGVGRVSAFPRIVRLPENPLRPFGLDPSQAQGGKAQGLATLGARSTWLAQYCRKDLCLLIDCAVELRAPLS
jgi:hypothetical protein